MLVVLIAYFSFATDLFSQDFISPEEQECSLKSFHSEELAKTKEIALQGTLNQGVDAQMELRDHISYGLMPSGVKDAAGVLRYVELVTSKEVESGQFQGVQAVVKLNRICTANANGMRRQSEDGYNYYYYEGVVCISSCQLELSGK